MAANVVVLDIETNDLDENKGAILEVACVVMNPRLTQELAFCCYTVQYSIQIVRQIFADSNDYIKELHAKNGLWRDLNALTNAKPLREISSYVRQMIRVFCGEGVKPIVVGNNVESFDKRFLRHHMRDLYDALHYRTINVSTLREVLRNEYNIELASEDKVNHRALDDCRSTVALYHECVKLLRAPMRVPGNSDDRC